MKIRRSVLFTPGDQTEMMRKALAGDADTVVFDLEDGVSPDAKDEAREKVVDVLGDADAEPEVCVRINPLGDGGNDDLSLLDEVNPDCVVVPKVESRLGVEEVSWVLSRKARGTGIIAVIETASGVLNAAEIAAAGVEAVVFGAEDLSADVGATRTKEGTEVLYAREKVVTAAAAAGVDSIDTLHTDIRDDEGLRDDAEFGARLGYDGKLAVHPRQVGIINEAFTPDDDRVEWARKVLEAAEEADEEGKGVFEVEGEMVDAPLVKQARTVVERARAAGLDV